MISDLGKNIKAIRQSKGLLAIELAQLAGVGNATISQIERGVRQTLQVETVQKLADALDVRVDELLGSEEKIKFETKDIHDILNIISYADFITMDDKPFTAKEKRLLQTSIKMTLDAIRYDRLKDSELKKN